MKTITQWLHTLPEPYRSQALNQPEELRFAYYPHSNIVGDLYSAIDNAFLWRCTEQGEEYWAKVYDRAMAGDFDNLGIDCTIPEDS